MTPLEIAQAVYQIKTTSFDDAKFDITEWQERFAVAPEHQQREIAKIAWQLAKNLPMVGAPSGFELFVRLHQLIVKHDRKQAAAMQKDPYTPEWYCWSCREWSKARKKPKVCPRCHGPMKKNGRCYAGWRDS